MKRRKKFASQFSTTVARSWKEFLLLTYDVSFLLKATAMTRKLILVLCVCVAGASWAIFADEPPVVLNVVSISPPTSLAEARSRAILLHETVNGTLKVMHRDFFDEDNSRTIPSASLQDVFDELAHTYSVELKWLIVETDIVNVDHQPEGDFEKAAVRALKDGKSRFEAIEANRYRYAGPIRLASQCLKCHVKDRKNTEDRTAGLLISMPLDLRP